ncbi:proline-rich protein 2-like [Psammomys obesus]|uniref:proline-rich protein 2-like n=1 Tax=Psammomys obesus TaxID=48139 RepID=UPI0024530790|nr:proline-rich protein 2-like [Psammomys obesus]
MRDELDVRSDTQKPQKQQPGTRCWSRAPSSEVEGSLRARPEGPSQQQLDRAGPERQDLPREGWSPPPSAGVEELPVAGAGPAAPREGGGTCSGVALPAARSQPRPPRRSPSPGGTPPCPPRPAPAPGAAHLSELPGVPPGPRSPRASPPCSGSSPGAGRPPGLRSPAAGVAVGVAGRGRSLGGLRPLRTKPARRRCSAAPAVSAPRSAGSSRPGTGNDLSSRSLPPRGAAGARREGCALRPPDCVGRPPPAPRRDARETEPNPLKEGPARVQRATCKKVPPGYWVRPADL